MRNKLLIILIFFLAFVLRFWQLGENPSSLDWDEASLGYNAYSILKSGRDEYGSFLPLAIRSFGDYKPALYTYLTVIPVAIFGLNEFSTRFISALFGTLTVIVAYFLIKELFPRKSSIFYFLFSIFFSLSPWHIQFSRVAFEANTALFFFTSGIWLFLKSIRQGKFFVLSFISFALSAYSYHSPRLVIPILVVGMTFIYRKEIIRQIKWFIVAVVIFILMIIPIVAQFRFSTAARFGSVTVINPSERLGPSIKSIEYDSARGDSLGKLMHNRRIVFGREILAGYLDHFNFDFLFLKGDPPGRHHASGMGMLYWFDLPFVLIGLFYLLRNRDKGASTILWWFLVAPIASSLTSGTPHAVRALLYLPTYQIFTAFGVVRLLDYFKNSPSRSRFATPGRWPNGLLPGVMSNGILFLFFSFFVLNFFYYLHMYWIHTPSEYASEWQYGYREAVEEVAKIEQHYDKVVVTYRYDQPYIYFLYYNKIDPTWYQKNWGSGEIERFGRNFGKYEFRNIDWEKDKNLTNTVLVGTPGEIPENTAGLIKEINFPDGFVAFRIVAR
ncbi:glycosyltransferase family 39 protein [Candidatus Gottesmanbacteria bacterium]|nr:glycosyltransferase family 39 protein [Candidatus Gottesmanbacteria bacterium]